MTRTHRALAAVILAAAVLVSIAIAVAGARLAGGSAATILVSAGALTEYLTPAVAPLSSLTAALTLGGGILAGWLLAPAGEGAGAKKVSASADGQPSVSEDDAWRVRARGRAMRIVAGASIAWTLLLLAQCVLSYSLSAGQSLLDPRFGSDIGVFFTSDLGRWMLASVVCAGTVSAVALAGESVRIARASTVLAAAALVCRAMTGHAAGSVSHESATSSMMIHLLAASAWIGPLIILLLLPAARSAGGAVALTVRRYSALALIAWIALAASGILALVFRVSSIEQILTTEYGRLGAAKAILLVILGGFGAAQRRAIARGEGESRGAFRTLAQVEILLMAAAVGLGAALSSSPPPADTISTPTSPAGILTGFDLPARLGSVDSLAEWRPDIFALGLAALVAAWAARAVAQGERGRPLLLALAFALYAVLASSPLAVYARVLASAHMLHAASQMLLVGFLLALALPSRALARLRENARGARVLPWILALLPAALVGGVYATPALTRLILESHPANLAWILAAIASGLALGAARAAGRRYGIAGGIALTVVWLSLALTTRAIAPSWFGATGRTWLANTLEDQHAGAWLCLALTALVLGGWMLNLRRYFSNTRRTV